MQESRENNNTPTHLNDKQGQLPVTAAGDEVEVAQSVPTPQALGMTSRTKSPALEKRQGRDTPSSES